MPTKQSYFTGEDGEVYLDLSDGLQFNAGNISGGTPQAWVAASLPDVSLAIIDQSNTTPLLTTHVNQPTTSVQTSRASRFKRHRVHQPARRSNRLAARIDVDAYPGNSGTPATTTIWHPSLILLGPSIPLEAGIMGSVQADLEMIRYGSLVWCGVSISNGKV